MKADRETVTVCDGCPHRPRQPRKHRTNPLPLNILVGKELRGNYYVLHSILPITLTVASIPFTYSLFTFLTHIGTLQPNEQPSLQPHQLIYNFSLLVTVMDLMFAAYVIGWCINIAIARYCLRWPRRRIIRVFLYSDIPNNWKQKHPTQKSGAQIWAETRAKGKARYVLHRGILICGVPFYLLLAVIPTLTGIIEPMLGFYAIEFFVCIIGGIVLALLIWRISEKQYLKHIAGGTK